LDQSTLAMQQDAQTDGQQSGTGLNAISATVTDQPTDKPLAKRSTKGQVVE
jgi:hypothetical protein